MRLIAYGDGGANAINGAQTHGDARGVRDVDSENAWHKLSLALLVFLVFADDTDHTLAADDPAMLAQPFD